MTKYMPLIVALVSGTVVLVGYVYEKDKEREFEDRRTQQEIYTRLITNLTTKQKHFERLRHDPRMPKRVTNENADEVYRLIAKGYPELHVAIYEAIEINALLSLYGTDNAIEASARYYRKGLSSMESGSTEVPNAGQFILDLRRSLFQETQVKAEDIGLLLSN